MLACLLTSLLTWQDPVPAPAPNAEAEPAPAVTQRAVVELDDRAAREVCKELRSALADASSMAEKGRALDKVADVSHARLLNPLADVVEKEKSVLLRKRAAALLRNQPEQAANKVIRRLLAKRHVQAHPGVLAELVHALSHRGYEPRQWRHVEDLFEQGYEAERVPLQEALLALITRHAEKQALELLLRNLDEPIPADVDHADNPPQEYWEARWKAWAVWKGKVADALFAITGQRFATAAEARAWLEKNPLR